MDLTSGENSVSWSLEAFDGMDDREIVRWYRRYLKTMTERNEALDKALKERRK